MQKITQFVALSLADNIPDLDLRRVVERSLSPNASLPQQVYAFHKLYGMPIIPTDKAATDFSHISRERLAMRFGLIVEEFMELCEAMDIRADINFLYLNEEGEYTYCAGGDDNFDHDSLSDEELHTITRQRCADAIEQTDERNLVEVADACGDLKYVIQGFELEVGIPSQAVLCEIHAANMTKLGEDGKPVRREDGKIMKGPNYLKPNVALQLSAFGAKLGRVFRVGNN